MGAEAVAVGWTTVGDRGAAEELARALLEARMAACVQIDGPVRSFYPWKGELCSEEEIRVWVKTTPAQAARIGAFLENCHPYETPQWIWSAADGSSADYADWVRGAVEKDGQAG